MPQLPRPHVPAFDLLRGIAIVAVVYLHSYFTPWPEASHDGLTALRMAHLVAHGAVPLFLFIAAYLQAAGEPETPWEHLRRRWWSVWLPAMLWMVAALVYRLVTDGQPGVSLRDLLLFNISGQFYFIWLLLFFGIVITQARRLPDGWLWPVIAVAFAVNLATIAWYEGSGDIGGTVATLAYRNPFAWVFFPAAGYALGRKGLAVAPARLVHAAIAVMVVAGAVHLYRGAWLDDWPVSYFGTTVFLFSAAGVVVYPVFGARLAARETVVRALGGLSRYAFPIYLVHLPFVLGFGTRELLGEGENWRNYWLLLHANAAVGLFVSLALVREIDKASPRLASLVLGVRNARRTRTSQSTSPAAESLP